MFSLTLSFIFSVEFSNPDKRTPVPKISPSAQPPSRPRSPPRSKHLSPPRTPHPETFHHPARHPSPPPSPMLTRRSHQPFYPVDATSTSLSLAAQKLQHHTREDIHQRRARENGGSDDATTLQTLEIATRGLEKRSAIRRRTGGSGFAGSESPAGTSCCGDDDRGRGRVRSPRRPRGAASTSSTTSAGDSRTRTSDFSFVDAETVLRGGRGRDDRDVSEQRGYSPLGVRIPTATRTMTGFAAATGRNDKDDDDDDKETWDLLTTPPPTTPSTTNPLLKFTRDEDESPESFLPFRQSGNPSTSSRSGIVSTSSSDQNWTTGLIHHYQKQEAENEDEDKSLSSANSQEKEQHQSLRGRSEKNRVGEGRDDLSPSSFSSQRKQEQQHPHFGSESNPSKTSERVHEVVQKYAMPRETKQERENHGKSGTQSQGEVNSSGIVDEDGWGVVGAGGDGSDDGWEMI